MNRVTIFTPTYNRGYILNHLYESLCGQSDYRFDWLIIDDGSTDQTETLVNTWVNSEKRFSIQYRKVQNAGKQRAINQAVQMIQTEYIFIVDSDDYLTADAIEKVNQWLDEIDGRQDLAGVSGIRGYKSHQPIGGFAGFTGAYIEASNLERRHYNLSADMAEIYKVDLLKRFPFSVWPGEKFVPEAVVWDEIALQGYKLRWYKDIIYICEYLEDGLTKGSWNLLENNPMGYAMLFNHQLKTTESLKEKCKIVLQMDSCICLANEKEYIKTSNEPLLARILMPAGRLLARRRRKQFAAIKNK